MHIDPPLQALFDAIRANPGPVPDPDDMIAVRAQADATMMLLHRPAGDDIEVRDHGVAVEGGSITVRTYRPIDAAGALPVIFFIHGGGWVQGTLDTAEIETVPMVESLRCFVVSVDYRLAPEHPFPTPLEDCVAAWMWLQDHGAALGADIDRVVVAGSSAGANLCAALCVATRDRAFPMPVAQVLDIPALDLTLASPSMSLAAASFGLTADAVRGYTAQYLQGADPTNPLVSPLLGDLTGLPPAFVTVAEHDPVRDDGERYVEALHHAGVAAAGVRVLAHLHGTWIIPITMTSRIALDLRLAALRRALDGTL